MMCCSLSEIIGRQGKLKHLHKNTTLQKFFIPPQTLIITVLKGRALSKTTILLPKFFWKPLIVLGMIFKNHYHTQLHCSTGCGDLWWWVCER